MATIDEKIREYGQKRDLDSLQQIMNTLEDDELINLIKTKISGINFTYTWNYILQCFTDTPDCHRKRYKMVKVVLSELREKDIPTSRSNSIINRLCIELTKFKSKHLADYCNVCLEYIQSKRVTGMVWKDLLPEILNVLVEREAFEYNDLEYTGVEYKTDFINTLCMLPWSPNIVTSLTAMFVDMPLTKDEHLKVVNKLGMYIEKMTPQEIPAFVYQLLKLCKQYNGRSMFLRLQNYFRTRIYNNASCNNESNSDSNLSNIDAIESTSNQDTIEAESTVLYHIHTAASLGHDCIKDYLNSLKIMVKTPEFILHPFQLMVLFTISTIPSYEETVFDIVRPSIVRYYNEEQRKMNSCWFREMVPTVDKPEQVLSQVISFSLSDRDLVLQALVNFGFVLLEVGSALGRDSIAEKQWNLGIVILLKIIKKKRHIAVSIIQTLSNHIVTRQTATQYIECLYILSKTLPLLMIENQSCIVELMESLVQVPGSIANQLLDALIPLTKISPTIRDHLIILLRKALYSRVTETRQMAVIGFLKLLTNLRISSLAALSQFSNSTGSFSSGHSLFTQISMSRSTQAVGSSAFSNEALCLEILSILKRCFMQQLEVRGQFYEGLYDAVCINPELGIPVLDLIWFHFSEYYVIDEDVLPPLNFSKITVSREVDSILMEPMGKLVYAIGLIVTQVSQSDENKENHTIFKFTNILDSLCQRMANCELVHFELDDGTDLLDILPESQQKVHVLKEAMSVYEALIGYQISSWNEQSEDNGLTINRLFQGYNRLVHFSKTLLKPKKGNARKKVADGNKTTQQMQQSQTNTKKDGPKYSKQIKTPDTILNFPTIIKALKLLHEPNVEWTTVAQANVIKTKCDFHQHIMQATMQLLQSIKKYKEVETRLKKLHYDHITDVAMVIFPRILKRLNEFIDFDCATAVLAMDCFYVISGLMSNQYKSNLESFMSKVAGIDKAEGFTAQLTEFIETFQKIFEMDEQGASDNPEVKKVSVIVVNSLNILVTLIPGNNNVLSVQMYEWLKNIVYNNTVSHKVSNMFINLVFETHIKYKVSLSLLEQISVAIGDTIGVVTEEEHNVEKLSIIDEGTVHGILLSMCSNIKSILDDIDVVIARIKSEYNILIYPGVENVEKKRENLKNKERGICCQVCFIVTILTNLSNVTMQPGNMSEAIFKNIILLYSTLSLLSKHFLMRSTKVNLVFQGARFERLVKLAGKQLAPAVYKLILHIEETQTQQAEPSQTQKKKKKKNVATDALKSKVLRETRLIPKVIYEIEQFSKCIIQLSNKTKVDLSKYLGQGTVRDFRIVQLKENLEKAATAISNTQSTETNASGDEVEASGQDSNEVDDTDDASPPPSKKSRK